jgi:hypothetical protein
VTEVSDDLQDDLLGARERERVAVSAVKPSSPTRPKVMMMSPRHDFTETVDRWENDANKHFRIDRFQKMLAVLFDAADAVNLALYVQQKERIEESSKPASRRLGLRQTR